MVERLKQTCIPSVVRPRNRKQRTITKQTNMLCYVGDPCRHDARCHEPVPKAHRLCGSTSVRDLEQSTHTDREQDGGGQGPGEWGAPVTKHRRSFTDEEFCGWAVTTVAHHVTITQCLRTIHLKLIKMVSCILHICYHNYNEYSFCPGWVASSVG